MALKMDSILVLSKLGAKTQRGVTVPIGMETGISAFSDIMIE